MQGRTMTVPVTLIALAAAVGGVLLELPVPAYGQVSIGSVSSGVMAPRRTLK
jgi:hypothetical protein